MDPEVQPVARRLTVLGVALLVLASLACGVGYKPNLGAKQLADTNRPHAKIVGYLSQTSADPAVCDLGRTDGVAIPFADKRVVKALHKGLEGGQIPPERWSRCMLYLWRTSDPILAADLGEGLLAALRGLSKGDWHPLRLARAEALRTVLVERETTEALPADRVVDVGARLRAASAREGTNSEAGFLLDELAEAVEVELGLYAGSPVTKTLIAKTDRTTRLAIWARRLPDARLRRRAGERLIARRIESSPFAWVRDHPDQVIATMANGPLAIPEDVPLRNARWKPAADGTALLRVLQEPERRKVWFLPTGSDGTRSADPSLNLAGTLWVDAVGFERPITVCDDTPFDPTPCIPPKRLEMTHPIATLAPTGRIVFPNNLKLGEVLKLGTDGDRLAAQVVIDGLVAEVDVPIVFDSVTPLWLQPNNKGNGPDIRVDVWELSNGRLLFEVRSQVLGRKVWKAVVESSDRSFKVTSYGYETAHQVGRGGNITVRMRCTNCKAVRKTLGTMIESRGAAPGRVKFRRVED